ncbi:hypothetical protein EI94DRAFT_1702751 [Lactarius quietus]|nr:hypothetical protein EI94DRAFT_1702751 [Lactarius quietus]
MPAQQQRRYRGQIVSSFSPNDGTTSPRYNPFTRACACRASEVGQYLTTYRRSEYCLSGRSTSPWTRPQDVSMTELREDLPGRSGAAHAPPRVWPEAVARLTGTLERSFHRGAVSDALPALSDAESGSDRKGVKEEEIVQLMQEVDLVKWSSHPGIAKQTLKAFGKLNAKLGMIYVFTTLEGLDYLYRSDVVGWDIKEHAELDGPGRPPCWDIGSAMTVMFQIVEDECPSTRERFSGPLVAFHNEYFPKDPEMQPSVEKLFEHEWLKNYWSLSKRNSSWILWPPNTHLPITGSPSPVLP